MIFGQHLSLTADMFLFLKKSKNIHIHFIWHIQKQVYALLLIIFGWNMMTDLSKNWTFCMLF